MIELCITLLTRNFRQTRILSLSMIEKTVTAECSAMRFYMPKMLVMRFVWSKKMVGLSMIRRIWKTSSRCFHPIIFWKSTDLLSSTFTKWIALTRKTLPSTTRYSRLRGLFTRLLPNICDGLAGEVRKKSVILRHWSCSSMDRTKVS